MMHSYKECGNLVIPENPDEVLIIEKFIQKNGGHGKSLFIFGPEGTNSTGVTNERKRQELINKLNRTT